MRDSRAVALADRDEGYAPAGEPRPHAPAGGVDLKTLLADYEKSLILAALASVGGRQRSAARLLRLLPTTLNEKMRRLGIRPQRLRWDESGEREQRRSTLRWVGRLAPGATLEVRGMNGPVRVEAAAGDEVRVTAVREGPWPLAEAVEVRTVEHAGGVTVCAVCAGPAPLPGRFPRRAARAVAATRVAISVQVPPSVRVRATTINDDIEVVGLAGNVEADTANGRIRFLAAPEALSRPAEA